MENNLYYFSSSELYAYLMQAGQKPVDIPQFALYGEIAPLAGAESVHIELIETRSRQYDWHIGTHTHAGLFQVLFLLRGDVLAHVDGADCHYSSPVALTIHPSLRHGFDFSHEAYGYVLTIEQNLLFGNAGDEVDLFSSLFVQSLALPLQDDIESQDRLKTLLENLHSEVRWPRHGQPLMLDWLTRSVLLLLVRVQAERSLAERTGKGEFEMFSRFRAEVERHYKEQWPVGHYANLLRIAPASLNRLCLKLAGKTAFELTQQRLMLEACRKLSYLPSSIASIAYELGFQDPAYFSRLFKKLHGMTPKEFRQNGPR
ncbi:MAG: AraC family transcriptional regulator [Massilia sp.]|nr:AraC family transcriptional regulator [Massilia sp.]